MMVALKQLSLAKYALHISPIAPSPRVKVGEIFGKRIATCKEKHGGIDE
ncbi:MAG: hypothetical protein PSV17_04815 [Methylotenera sp.]|nr:hypothetical protein [Methylotenera sp.]MDI1308741.1 hypothetical protein [Methylotenera sp.]